MYKGTDVGNYRPDLVVEDKIILELKAVEFMPKTFETQLINYLKTTGYKLGLLVNFGAPKLYIKRLVWTDPRKSIIKDRRKSSAALQQGFTLIEVLTAVVILATLLIATLFVVSPITQLNKANDSKRQAAIGQIKNALDLYYHDKNCYPAAGSAFTTALAAGTTWTEGSTVYIKKVPLDDAGHAYKYIVETGTCPQWSVVFAKLNNVRVNNNTCSLALVTEQDCTPNGYDASWACTTLGSLGTTGCSQVAAAPITY